MALKRLEKNLHFFYLDSLSFFKKKVFHAYHADSLGNIALQISRQFLKATVALAEALPGYVQREKTPDRIEIKFQTQDLHLDPIFQETFHRFIQFDIRTKMPFERSPITPPQITKATHLASLKSPESILFESLLLITKKNATTRSDFNEKDWKALDLVNFELIQECFDNLNILFNSKSILPQAKLLKESFGIDLYESIIAETFAKSMVPNRHYDGKKINIPVLDPNGLYKLVTFTISDLILGDELPAYILESNEPHIDPWIVIRGTESIQKKNSEGKELRKGSGESIIADCIDRKGIARDVVIKALVNKPIINDNGNLVQKPSLYDNFEKWKAEGKKAKIAGHSLGGYLAIDLTIQMFDFVRQTYAFNAPGVSCKQARAWDNIIKTSSQQTGIPVDKVNSKVIQYNTEGDIVPTSGRKLIGAQFAVEPAKKFKKKDPIHDHLWNILSKNFSIQKIDIVKENQKFPRRIIEKLRSSAGLPYREILLHKQPDWWLNRKLYRAALKMRKTQ